LKTKDHIIDSEKCDEEIKVEEVVLEITLNALLGSPSPNTMRVVSNIKNHKAVVLLNTGSTHNFLDWSLAKALELTVDISKLVKVKMANGVVINTKGEAKQVLIKVQRHQFSVNFSLLELEGCGVVLETLGLISWDFKKLQMGFMHQGRHVWLQELKTGRSSL
jgi:hypothetical protein